MSKVFAIVFSSVILLQSFNISFEDFSKLNVLLNHAEYHQEKYGDSFFSFLTEHYVDNILQHEYDHEDHENLPFKHRQDCTHTSYHFIETPWFYISNNNQSYIQVPFSFFYKESFSLFEKSSVFQPPKLA